MRFDVKTGIIFALSLVILLMLFGRRMSFADAMPSTSPSLSLAANVPSGAILPKSAEEACEVKYGAGWIGFSPTLCKKA